MRKLCIVVGVLLVWMRVGASTTCTIFNGGCSNITMQFTANIAGNSYGPDVRAVNSMSSYTYSVGATWLSGGWFRCQYSAVGNCSAYDSGYITCVGLSGTMLPTCGLGCACTNIPCNTNFITVKVANNSSVWQTYSMTEDGNLVGGDCRYGANSAGQSTNMTYTSIPPGGQGQMQAASCDATNRFAVSALFGPTGAGTDGSVCFATMGQGSWRLPLGAGEYSLVSTNYAAYGGGVPPADNLGAGGPGGGWTNGPSTSGTNGIGFPSGVTGSTNPTDIALVNGFGALYSALKEVNAIGGQSRDALYRIAGELLTNSASGGGGSNAVTDMSGTTNLLGKILSTEQGESNTLDHIGGILTGTSNILSGSSNLLSGMGNTLSGMSNITWGMGGALSSISNGVSGISSNISAWFGTNLAWMHAGQDALGSWSNSVGDSGKVLALRDSYISPLKGVADGERAGFEGGVANGDSGAYAPDSSVTLLSFSDGGTTYTIDCDVLHNSALAELWAVIKGVMWWAATCYYYYTVVGWSMRACREALLVPQMGFPKLTVLGNSVGASWTPVFIGIVMTAIAAVGQVLAGWVAGDGASFGASIRTDPLIGHPALGTAIAWMNAVIPWQYLLGLVCAGFAFRWQLFGVYMASSYVVKLCVD